MEIGYSMDMAAMVHGSWNYYYVHEEKIYKLGLAWKTESQ